MCAHKAPRPYRRKRPCEAIYNALVQRGRHAVRITYEQFAELTKQSECHYCGSAVVWSEHRKRGETTATNLDRKDNDRPYELGNVAVCCLRCNKAKNTHFSYDEWRELGRVIRGWRALALLQKELEAAVPVSETHVPERETPPAFDILKSRTVPSGNTPDTEYHPSRQCGCASCQRMTYDERRGEIPPCQCGRLFTHPHRCREQGRCLALDHPHARK